MDKFRLPKTYDFKKTEGRIYRWWEESGFFRPSNDPNQPGFDDSKKPFVISIPPPNITGGLHVGHSMFVAMEDLMIRYNRMKGIPTLWVPGSDHAGIATQLQIEKSLAKEGLHRDDIGRDEFVRRTWEWKDKYGHIITNQIRRLGASCDWDRERFTLDEGLSQAVRFAFVRLYEKGLIYRGPRLITWSPGLRTAVSDLEVEYFEEPGKLFYFKYMLSDGSGDFIPVATTRPETILGDTAVAVHPNDKRYENFIGKTLIVPILGREIPVIADDYVDSEFGTGALKVTPGHDLNDFQIGKKHDLEVISVLNERACVNENGGPYEDLDRFVARERLWEDMQKANLVIKEEPYMLNIPRSQRGGEIVEPMISTQWFVDIKPLAKPALEAVKNGKIKIIPKHFEKVYFNWLENILDWCISRQLWWGHRIPVWYCLDCQENGKSDYMTVSIEDPTNCQHCDSERIEQDPDVLDTWFSSGLWPFSTLGWPEKTRDLDYFYPTSIMETGYDIIFFWVARMIMMGLEFTGEIPFHTVYLHGLIRDGNGTKMSKSYGNVIDPLEVMDQFGTDALRFTLLVGSSPGKDVNLDLKKVEGNRNFANKLWNITRFVLNALKNSPNSAENDPEWTLADSWIWAQLQMLIRNVERLFENHQYGEAGRQIYDFFWGDFADWYIEIAKLQLNGERDNDRRYYTAYTLTRVLDLSLRLLHPFTPFVTEELWGILKNAVKDEFPTFSPKNGWEPALIIADWPNTKPEEGWEKEVIHNFSLVQKIIKTIRNFRSESAIDNPDLIRKRIPAEIIGGKKTDLIHSQMDVITTLARLDPDQFRLKESPDEKPSGYNSLVVDSIQIFILIHETVDKSKELIRLRKSMSEVSDQIKRISDLLAGPFSEKAPQEVVKKEIDRLSGFKETAKKLENQIEEIENSRE